MDCPKYTTEKGERKKDQHLRMEDRGAIKVLKKQGLGVRAIARAIGCAPSTVTNELRRGIPERKGGRGRMPGYSVQRGAAEYEANRRACHRPVKQDLWQVLEKVDEALDTVDDALGEGYLDSVMSQSYMRINWFLLELKLKELH